MENKYKYINNNKEAKIMHVWINWTDGFGSSYIVHEYDEIVLDYKSSDEANLL